MQRTFYTLLFLVLVFTVNAQVRVADSLALVALYEATNGDQWTNNDNWLSDQPVSTWYGVTTADDRVWSVYLWANNLDGTLPDEIGDLSGMFYLDLYGNKLQGSIPATIGQCVQLRELYLYENQLSGTVPETMSNCKELKVFVVSGNELSGPFPGVLLTFLNLERLEVSGNQFSGSIPAGLSQLTKLELLDLSRNNFSGPMPSMRDLDLLSQCHLSYNQLTGDIEDFLDYKGNMYYFGLSGNLFTGTVSETLFNPDKLQFFDLQENNFTGLGDFSSFKSGAGGVLKRLNVYGNEMPFEDLEPNRVLSNFTYAPQDNLLDTLTVTLLHGEALVMDAGSDGEFTSYQWYHNGEAIPGATQREYHINSFESSDAGEYYAVMQNSVLSNLTLQRNPVQVIDGTTSAIDIISSHILLYPNPALDHVVIPGLDSGSIFICDAKGQVKYEGSASHPIDIRNWSSGEYFVVVKESGVVGRFIVR